MTGKALVKVTLKRRESWMQQHNIRQGTEAAPEVSHANEDRNRVLTARAQETQTGRKKSTEITIQMLLLSGENISSQQSLK